ncbi:MAG: hypothetical protein OXE50_09525 [Chloroflexi bacterium]|nr:hypothetical protein [Chloroflexota bacterium]
MRRKWLLIPALAALLLTGAIAGTAFAQDESSGDSSKVSRFVEILAGKLGIDEDQVQTAVEETKAELQAERKAAWEQQLRDKLASMVEDGSITQEQADEYLDWYLDPPELASGKFGKKFAFRGDHHRGKRGGWGHGWKSGVKDSEDSSSDSAA